MSKFKNAYIIPNHLIDRLYQGEISKIGVRMLY